MRGCRRARTSSTTSAVRGKELRPPAPRIAGLSMGGSQTLNIAFSHLDRFAYIGVFSSGILGGGRGARGAAPGAAAPPPPGAAWQEQHLKTPDDPALKRGLELVWFSRPSPDSSGSAAGHSPVTAPSAIGPLQWRRSPLHRPDEKAPAGSSWSRDIAGTGGANETPTGPARGSAGTNRTPKKEAAGITRPLESPSVLWMLFSSSWLDVPLVCCFESVRTRGRRRRRATPRHSSRDPSPPRRSGSRARFPR